MSRKSLKRAYVIGIVACSVLLFFLVKNQMTSEANGASQNFRNVQPINNQTRARQGKLDDLLAHFASIRELSASSGDLFAALKEFRQLNAKVLFTPQEKAKLQKQMSDSKLIRDSFLSLAEPNDNIDMLQENQMLRMMALDFLEASIRWKQNPAIDQVRDSIYFTLIYDNIENISNLEIRKSIGGDKVEAYVILKENDPEKLKELDELPEDGRIRKLIRYAERLTQEK